MSTALTQSDSAAPKVFISGANGHLGQKLIKALNGYRVIALVRSNSALAKLNAQVDQQGLNWVEVVQVDFNDTAQFAEVIKVCDFGIHLIGIIKESKTQSFEATHIILMKALIAALGKVNLSQTIRLYYLSLVGASAISTNPCFKTRAEAEQDLLAAVPQACIIRIPMVLGEGDYASFALKKRAMAKTAFSFRSSSLEQPIYAGDIIKLISFDLKRTKSHWLGIHSLAGPVSLSRKALQQQANTLLNQQARLISLPLILGKFIAAILERMLARPPMTRAMLDVLDHDDHIDISELKTKLGFELTPLETMLRYVLIEPNASVN